MQQIEAKPATTGEERRRVESVVQTLARLHSRGESLAEVAHDARNMVTALGLYCELLDQPGVLAPAFAHYGAELRLVAAASSRLVEKLVALDSPATSYPPFLPGGAPAVEPSRRRLTSAARPGEIRFDLTASAPVANLAAELLATRNLLAALAGPSIALTVDAAGGALPARISGEDLTRVLVNLVKNAVEAMPASGRIQITLREQTAREGADSGRRWLVLAVEDNGPGIPGAALEQVFEPGYTAHPAEETAAGARAHRGLGLAISRSIVNAAGGHIYARNRALGGAQLVIELPVDDGRCPGDPGTC